MEQTIVEKGSPFATEPIGKLIARFAIPSVIALLVNSLYNIVDQIFIGWGVGYLGNGATNIVFPITTIALALSMMIGNGGAAYLSLKLGEGDQAAAKKGVGNAIGLVVIVSIVLAAVFLVWIDPILTLFGATDVLRPYALEYGFIIGLGLPFMMISASINSMIRADGSPKYAMVSMVIGAVCNVILNPVFIFAFHMGVEGAAIATVIGQVASFVVSVIYLPRFKTIHPSRLRSLCLPGQDLRQYRRVWPEQFYHPVCYHRRYGANQQPSGRLRCRFHLRRGDSPHGHGHCDEGQSDSHFHSAGHCHRRPADSRL